ncbi:MAG: hypothetical protein AAGC64_11830 [Bacteroidota bacterium]
MSILLFYMLLGYFGGSQKDTSFVYVDDIRYFRISVAKKAPNDPDQRQYFPYNGGKYYSFSIKNGRFDEDCYFSWKNWHMIDETPFPNFEAHQVHIDTLREIDFKDAHWFQTHSYGSVLREFSGNEKVIYLIDGTEIKDDSTYMVRVTFRHPAEE